MICYACNRTLKRPPIIVGGFAYGPVCAQRTTPRRDPLEADMLTSIDLEGAVLNAKSRLSRELDASVSRHMAAMRAGWRARA